MFSYAAISPLFTLLIFAFTIWMFFDCITHNVKDKIFWALLIVGTLPIGGALYASKRPRLIGVSETTYTAPDGSITTTVTTQTDTSKSSQVIRGLGITIGAIFAVFGLLMVGFIILLMIAFSSGGGSEGGGK